MALALNHLQDDLQVIAGYESGYTCVWHRASNDSDWNCGYVDKTHIQPILSLDVAKKNSTYFTSAADAMIVGHPMYADDPPAAAKVIQTRHSGQQALTVRSDGKLFATAGWDGRIRVYSVKTMRELAVLKWHKEGCYALAFADLDVRLIEEASSNDSDVRVTLASPLTVEQRRNMKAQTTHWLAAGAKDGKVSLWDIY